MNPWSVQFNYECFTCQMIPSTVLVEDQLLSARVMNFTTMYFASQIRKSTCHCMKAKWLTAFNHRFASIRCQSRKSLTAIDYKLEHAPTDWVKADFSNDCTLYWVPQSRMIVGDAVFSQESVLVYKRVTTDSSERTFKACRIVPNYGIGDKCASHFRCSGNRYLIAF